MKKVDLDNTIVEAKNDCDGKIILDFFKESEFPTFRGQSFPTGFRYSHDGYGNQKIYYGIIDGDLNCFKENEIQNYKNVKILEMVDGHIKLPVEAQVEEKIFPRVMLVWDKEESEACKSIIEAYLEGADYPWLAISKRHRDKYYGYKNAKEIVIVETISKEEAEKRLGVKIED